jgi:DUF1680 family protein
MKSSTIIGATIVLAGVLFQAFVEAAEIRNDYPIQPVRFKEVQVEDGYWSPRLETNRTATVPHVFKQCEETGIIDNFAKAAGVKRGPYSSSPWADSVVGTMLCAVYNSVAIQPNPVLEAKADEVVKWIGAAQEPDGYLYAAAKVMSPEQLKPHWAYERWVNAISSHELFNVGHLYEAAVASYESTGKREFLDIALKNADLVCRDFVPGKFNQPQGHAGVELALVKLYRVTGQRKYLDCAKQLLDWRGDAKHHKIRGMLDQQGPLAQQSEVTGHQVSAMYCYAGMTDVAALTGDKEYGAAVERLWEDFVSRKMYITGTPGGTEEMFAKAYDLPNKKAYSESCMAISVALWSHRMFLLSGDAKYMDMFERVLYNGLAGSVSLDGKAFWYKDPLAADAATKINPGTGCFRRSPWHPCPCCPPNIARFIPSLPGYVYAADQKSLYVNLFMGSRTALQVNGAKVQVRQETRYPWEGKVSITIDAFNELDPSAPVEFGLRVRVPGWAQGRPVPSDLYRYEPAETPPVKLTVNGTAVPLVLEKGYAVVHRVWEKGDKVELEFPMPVRRVVAHEKVLDDVGRVALERGPVVYCVEGVDNGSNVVSLVVKPGAKLTAEFRSDLLGGVTVLKGKVEREIAPGKTKPCELLAVPYSTWANRELGTMAVWLIGEGSEHCVNAAGQWTPKQANEWYAAQPWLCGFNYIPATAINTTEMWQKDTFDAKTIDEELALAQDIGFNCIRVHVQYLVWEDDPNGLKQRIEQFLAIASKRGMRTMLVLFDDCNFSRYPEPFLGKQPDVVPGHYANGWTPSPGPKRVKDRAAWPKLERYVKDLVGTFAADKRVLAWETYNEPVSSLPLVEASFAWAREAKPSQPVTATLIGHGAIPERVAELSDVISFHEYDDAPGLERRIKGLLRKHGRPVLITEWLNRPKGSLVETCLPVLARHRAGAFNWGMVNGKTQTQFWWHSKAGTPEPKVWQHDLFRKDRTPYDEKELALFKDTIRQMSASGKPKGNPEP